MNEIQINGETYIKKELMSVSGDKPMVMIRTYSAGVFYGILDRKESTLAGMEVTILNARRVWQWSGAASLSQLSQEGTSNPDGCKFPMAVNSIDLVAIEIIQMTEKAVKSLNSVKVWNQ